MEENKNKLSYLKNHFDQKKQKKYGFDVLERLMKKVEDKNDAKVLELAGNLLYQLDLMRKDDSIKAKMYFKLFNELKKHVKTEYGFVPKGTVQGEYMAMGVALGVAFGAAFTTINTAFIGIGIPIGIAIGLAIGSSKEKELEEQDKLY
jgi:hypothetical protein